jgi:hypothetical protein
MAMRSARARKRRPVTPFRTRVLAASAAALTMDAECWLPADPTGGHVLAPTPAMPAGSASANQTPMPAATVSVARSMMAAVSRLAVAPTTAHVPALTPATPPGSACLRHARTAMAVAWPTGHVLPEMTGRRAATAAVAVNAATRGLTASTANAPAPMALAADRAAVASIRMVSHSATTPSDPAATPVSRRRRVVPGLTPPATNHSSQDAAPTKRAPSIHLVSASAAAARGGAADRTRAAAARVRTALPATPLCGRAVTSVSRKSNAAARETPPRWGQSATTGFRARP